MVTDAADLTCSWSVISKYQKYSNWPIRSVDESVILREDQSVFSVFIWRSGGNLVRNFIPILSRWLCQLGAMTALRASAWRAGRLSVFTVADPQKFLQIRSRIRRNLLAYFFRLYGKQTVSSGPVNHHSPCGGCANGTWIIHSSRWSLSPFSLSFSVALFKVL